MLLGLDPATGAVAVVPHVLESAVASADMLGAMPMEVEVGNAQLAPGQGARPETAWFTDGEQLAKKLPGTGTVTVAAFGPRLPAQPLSATDGRVVSADSGQQKCCPLFVVLDETCRSIRSRGHSEWK